MRCFLVVNDAVELGKPLIPAPGQLAEAADQTDGHYVHPEWLRPSLARSAEAEQEGQPATKQADPHLPDVFLLIGSQFFPPVRQ
jgi:hypothetical protein